MLPRVVVGAMTSFRAAPPGLRMKSESRIGLLARGLDQFRRTAARLCANSRIWSRPTATCEAILPSSSSQSAEGVPFTPKIRPALNAESTRMAELNPILLLSSTDPPDMRTKPSLSDRDLFSQALQSDSICCQ